MKSKFFTLVAMIVSSSCLLVPDLSHAKKQSHKTNANNYVKTTTNFTFEKSNYNSIYITGKRGGCYTISPSGRKNYVPRSYCQ